MDQWTTLTLSFQLAGRVLLIFLFIGFIFQGSWSFARVLVSIIGLGACIMVAVGFKAKWSASFLVTLLSVFNIFVNNWWSLHRCAKFHFENPPQCPPSFPHPPCTSPLRLELMSSAHPQKDFLKYDL
jgi:uncharacterized membrane protein YphA (DoxX/SURF4 family)